MRIERFATQHAADQANPIKSFACGGKALLRQPIGGSALQQEARPQGRAV
jgi:hypothetical protein